MEENDKYCLVCSDYLSQAERTTGFCMTCETHFREDQEVKKGNHDWFKVSTTDDLTIPMSPEHYNQYMEHYNKSQKE